MLNHTRGGSHTLVKMLKRNKDYAEFTVYNGRSKDSSKNVTENSPIKPPISHKIFRICGVDNFNFAELDLGADGWTDPHPPNDKGDVVASVDRAGNIKKIEENLYTNRMYKCPEGILLFHLDYEKDCQDVYLHFTNPSKDNSKLSKKTKSMLERILRFKIREIDESDEEEKLVSELIDKLELESN